MKQHHIQMKLHRLFALFHMNLFTGTFIKGLIPATTPATSFELLQQNLKFLLQTLNPFQHSLLILQHSLPELYTDQINVTI